MFKNESSFVISKTFLKKISLTLLFLIFLIPYSYEVNNLTVSVNYSFILFPALLILINQKLYNPNKNIFLIFAIYIFLFVFNLTFQLNSTVSFPRKFISFFIFISIFSFAFIKIRQYWIDSFIFSIVFFSFLMSLFSIYNFYSLFYIPNIGLKSAMGSQILGFVYIFSIWINTYINYKKELNLVKYFITTIIIIGTLNLFTKAAVLVLIISYLFFLLTNLQNKLILKKNVYIFFLTIFFLSILLYYNKAILNKYYDEYFFYFTNINFSNPYSSESERLYLILKVFKNNDLINFFFGNSYLGIWILDENLYNNAHNQYLDVFFRTGTIGLFCYLYLIYLILKSLKNINTGMFYGFISILIYSMFIDTFKLSHGAFIMSFLIGVCNNNIRVKNFNRKN